METKTEPTEIQKFMQDDIKKHNIYIHFRNRPFTSNGTEFSKHDKLRGVGITRKNKEASKKSRKTAKLSRKMNRGK